MTLSIEEDFVRKEDHVDLIVTGPWDNEREYKAGEMAVDTDNYTYQANVANIALEPKDNYGPDPETYTWTRVAVGSQGPTGASGSAANRETWIGSPPTHYYEDDLVQHGDPVSTYFAKVEHWSSAGTEPGTVGGEDYWGVFAGAGQDGDTAVSGTPTVGNLAKFKTVSSIEDGPAYGTSGASKLLQLDGDGRLPAIDGRNLTGLPNSLTSKSSPVGADEALIYSIADGAIRKSTLQQIITAVSGFVHSDWTDWDEATYPCAYYSAADPTFVMKITGIHAVFCPGQRLKLTQTTTKYFIVLKVETDATYTYLTLFGGTDYDLANAAISNVYYSGHYAPVGFPLDKTIWRIYLSSSTDYIKASPTYNTWMNTTSTPVGVLPSITLPLGHWRVKFRVLFGAYYASGSTDVTPEVALSTSTSSASDTDLIVINSDSINTTSGVIKKTFYCEKLLTLAADTVYYLIWKNANTDSISAIKIYGSEVPTMISAECAYV
jgi:hypothetical protein